MIKSMTAGGRLAQLGILGFAFFFLKGLAWLAAIAWGAWAFHG